jgi:hypothetical protein
MVYRLRKNKWLKRKKNERTIKWLILSLNIYKYLKYLLTEIPQHMDDTDTDFIEDLLPWSRSLPPECRKKKASN